MCQFLLHSKVIQLYIYKNVYTYIRVMCIYTYTCVYLDIFFHILSLYSLLQDVVHVLHSEALLFNCSAYHSLYLLTPSSQSSPPNIIFTFKINFKKKIKKNRLQNYFQVPISFASSPTMYELINICYHNFFLLIHSDICVVISNHGLIQIKFN